MSNGIHAGVVLGQAVSDNIASQGLDDLNSLNALKVSVRVNGKARTAGFGRDIMEGEGPGASMKWLQSHLLEQGASLKPEDVVIPGSPVELVRMQRGDLLEVELERVGRVAARFV